MWWLFDDVRLGQKCRDLISEPDNNVAVSTISAFEIATKYRIGKWPDVKPIAENFETLVLAENFRLLPIAHNHALLAGRFSMRHKDPFDRLLAAQAYCEELVLVSAGTAFNEFPVQRLW
ncbi:type II toxin-antitoxin system VapC family toxin [Rhizobium sp. FY34]|uniref:type II toxin-antitoxin system VapC family toxin n=1 Tax=Rhizobium sp. FY34 TaxID=2562309 RepID=UPI001FED9FB5|nr:type II toxin-antitoxin system VapC family toxin [Rhizobium sp. FY34]